MEWIERLNQAVNYIEEHLTEDVNYEEAAHVACCSVYHFQRMFSYLAGVPLSEYIRRRRMSLAAVDLQAEGAKVVDIALKYGYDSPTAFNRAFQSVHGLAPSQAKQAGKALKAYPPISFQITVKGVTELDYRIEKRERFQIVGLAEPMAKEIEKNFDIVPKMWTKAAVSGALEKMVTMMDSEPQGVLGVSACGEDEEWQYFIAVASQQPAPEGWSTYTVEAQTWAIFPGEGPMPTAIQDLEQRIVREWLPTSGYEYANGPDIECYLNADPQHAAFEVWIPVVRK